MAKRYRRTKKRRKGSNSSWRVLKQRFHLRKRLRRFGLALLVFSSVLLTLVAVHLWGYFGQPFAGAAGQFGIDGSWDGRQPLNLLWLEISTEGESAPLKNFSVVSLNPTSGRFTIFTLPLEYEVSIPLHGSRPLRSIYELGNLLEPEQGVELAAKRASYLLGISIDGYLVMSTSGLQELVGYFGTDDLKSCLSFRNLVHFPQILNIAREHLRTNLSLAELVRVIHYLWRVRPDRMRTVGLQSKVLSDQDVVDSLVGPAVRDEMLVAERLKIQVLNGTYKPGLASFVGRVVRNMGGEVIRVGNYERQDLTRGFLVLDESGSYTAKRFARAFGVVDGRPSHSSAERRADVTIVLGSEECERIF